MKWRARISPNPLIVVAASARPFVRAAAVTGRRVIAADVFGDTDTRQVAERVIRLGYRQGGFDVGDVREQLLPVATPDTGLVYGSGFETQPWLLEELAQRCQLFGNQAETVRIVKDPDLFFSLLSRLKIAFPEFSFAPPASAIGWLSKRIGGSGGTHIVPLADKGGADRYCQRKVPGKPVSLLFLADGQQVRAIGYNLQFLAPLPEMPYRYGGAVSHVALPDGTRSAMLSAAARITAELGLLGLNSLDCLVDRGHVWVLEVNPRLSATFSLYDANHYGASLMEGHIQASMGVMPPPLPHEPSQAHLIYYAPFDLAVPAAMAWPDWVADVPETASRVRAEEPLCTVMASAADANQAVALARARLKALTQLVTNFY